jgi:tellurite resistance protein TehA-like permease
MIKQKQKMTWFHDKSTMTDAFDNDTLYQLFFFKITICADVAIILVTFLATLINGFIFSDTTEYQEISQLSKFLIRVVLLTMLIINGMGFFDTIRLFIAEIKKSSKKYMLIGEIEDKKSEMIKMALSDFPFFLNASFYIDIALLIAILVTWVIDGRTIKYEQVHPLVMSFIGIFAIIFLGVNIKGVYDYMQK